MSNNMVRGIRGAIDVKSNTVEDISLATKVLLKAIVDKNEIKVEDIASIFFTVSPDLNAFFPATAARELGWHLVPMLCAREIDVPDGPVMLLRVIMHVNTTKTQEQIKHQYLGKAAALRPDLVQESL